MGANALQLALGGTRRLHRQAVMGGGAKPWPLFPSVKAGTCGGISGPRQRARDAGHAVRTGCAGGPLDEARIDSVRRYSQSPPPLTALPAFAAHSLPSQWRDAAK